MRTISMLALLAAAACAGGEVPSAGPAAQASLSGDEAVEAADPWATDDPGAATDPSWGAAPAAGDVPPATGDEPGWTTACSSSCARGCANSYPVCDYGAGPAVCGACVSRACREAFSQCVRDCGC